MIRRWVTGAFETARSCKRSRRCSPPARNSPRANHLRLRSPGKSDRLLRCIPPTEGGIRDEHATAIQRGVQGEGSPGGAAGGQDDPGNRSAAKGPSEPAHICLVRVGGLCLRGVPPLVPRVHLSVSFAGPAPSDSAGAFRRCEGCFHLHRCPSGRAALSFIQAAAIGADGCDLWPPQDSRTPRGARYLTSRHDWVLGRWFAGHQAHQTPHSVMPHTDAFPPQMADHLAAAVERVLEKLLVDPPHQRQVRCALPPWAGDTVRIGSHEAGGIDGSS